MDANSTLEASCKTYYNGHKGKAQALSWNREGFCLASGSVDMTARIYHAENGELRTGMQLCGHRGAIHSLDWDPTSAHTLVTASKDKTVRVWDTRQRGGAGVSISTAGENINVSWCSNGRIIAVGNDDDVICFIDARKLRALHQKKYPYQVNEFGWNASSSHFFMTALGGNTQDKSMGTVEISSCGNGDGTLEHVYSVHAHTAACYCIGFDPTHEYFATGSADSLVSLWSLDNLICVRTVGRHENPIRSLSFSHDGKLLASGSESKFLDVAAVESGEQLCSIPTGSSINAMEWHPRANLLAFADQNSNGIHIATVEAP